MSVHLIFEFLTAFVGTIAFALLFQVPKEYYVNCGLAGGCGWVCYKLLLVGCGLFGSTFFCYGSCRFSLQAQCGPAPLPGDDLSRCRHLPAGSGSRDLLDCLLCRDGSAGQSFRPWIPDFEDRGGDRAWHPVCL